MTGGVFILSVSFDVEALGGRAADTAMPAEAINYFCEIRMEEELERARTRTREKTPVQAQDNSRNTVLVLPKIHRFVSNSNIDCETTLKRHVSKSSPLSFWFLFFNSRSRNVEQKIKIVFTPQNSDDLEFSFLSANGVSRGWEKHTAVTVTQKERRLLH